MALLNKKTLKLPNDQILQEFLYIIFGKYNSAIEKIIKYLKDDGLFNAEIPEEIWEILSDSIHKNTDSVCNLMSMLRLKINEIYLRQENKNVERYIYDKKENKINAITFDSGENGKNEINRPIREKDEISPDIIKKDNIEDKKSIYILCYSKINQVFIKSLRQICRQIDLLEDKPKKCNLTNGDSFSNVDNKNDSYGYNKDANTNEIEFSELISKLTLILSSLDDRYFNHEELDDIFDSMLKLIYVDNSLNIIIIYLSLFSSSLELLKRFCEREKSFIKNWNMLSVGCCKKDTLSDNNFKRVIYFNTVEGLHILTFFYNSFLNVVKKDREQFKNILNMGPDWCSPLYMILFLHIYSLTEDKLSLSGELNLLLNKYGDSCDPLIKSVLLEKKRHFNIIQWCLDYHPTLTVSKTLKLLQDHSVLYAIQASVPLHKIPYQKALEILVNENDAEKEDDDYTFACALTYCGFYILLLSFNSIVAGMEMEKFVHVWRNLKKRSRSNYESNYQNNEMYINNCKGFYKIRIVKLLDKIIDIFSDITDIRFCVEILENLFSLLFLYYTDLSDEAGSNSSWDEIDTDSPSSMKQDMPSFPSESLVSSTDNIFSETNLSKIGSPIDKVKRVTNIPSKFYGQDNLFVNQVELSNLQFLENISSDFSSSSSVSDFPNRGYIMNTLVIWDHILLLKELINHVKDKEKEGLFVHNKFLLLSIEEEEVSKRLNELQSKVDNALWRIKLLMPKYENRELGCEDQVMDFMNESLISNVSMIIRYDDDSFEIQTAKKTKLKNKLTFNKEKPGLINFLLSSPQNLLKVALVNNNIDGAQMILNKYNLQNCSEKQEIVLMKCLNENIPKIEEVSTLRKDKQKNFLDCKDIREDTAAKFKKSINSNSSDIAISCLIDQTLNLYMLENTDNDDYIKNEIFPKLILIDIALTSQLSEENAIKLLNVAFSDNKMPKISKGLAWHHNLQSYFKDSSKLSDLIFLIHKIKNGEYKTFSSQLSIRNPASLLLCHCPLDLECVKQTNKEWLSVIKCITNFISNYGIVGNKGSKIKSNSSDLIEYYNSATQVLNNCTFITQRSSRGTDYMRIFFSNLKLIEAVIKEHKAVSPKTKNSIMKNIFALLNQRPVNIFGQLLFVSGIDPIFLEAITKNMNLDLLTVITMYVFPEIPIGPTGNNKHKLSHELYGCHFIDGNYVLNANKLSARESKNGDYIVNDLLSSLLDRLKEINFEYNDLKDHVISKTTSSLFLKDPQIKSILLETSDISFIDIKKLQPGRELLVFFINLANLMFIHVILINSIINNSQDNNSGIFSHSFLEIFISLKNVGYLVGELGFVSLYTILTKILKQPIIYEEITNTAIASVIKGSNCKEEDESSLITLLENLLPEIPNELIFVISQLVNPSPKINVYYPDNFEDRLSDAISEYFNHCIIPNHMTYKNMEPNAVMSMFVSLCYNDINVAIDKLKKHLGDDMTFYLDWLRKFGYRKGINNSSIRKDFTPNILLRFEYTLQEMADDEHTVKPNVEQPSNIHLHNVVKDNIELPFEVASYVKERNPIISIFLENFVKSKKPHHVYLNTEENLAQNSKFNTIFLQNMLKLSKNKGTMNDLIDLFVEADYSSIIHDIEKNLAEIPSQKFEGISNIKTFKKILNMFRDLENLPSLLFCKYSQLSYIWDEIAGYLASQNVNICENAYLYTYRIKNSRLRYYVVRKHYGNWPLDGAISCLHLLDHDKCLTDSEKEWVSQKLYQLELHAELSELIEGGTKENINKLEPKYIIEQLNDKKLYSLIVKYINCNNLSDKFYFEMVRNSLLECLDIAEPNFTDAKSKLNDLSINKLDDIITDLLRNLKANDTRKFLINKYLEKVESCSNFMTDNFYTIKEKSFSLRQELMGIILIDEVAPKHFKRTQLFPLIKRPLLILEQWVMNLNLDAVEKGIRNISTHLEDIKVKDSTEDVLSSNQFYQMIEKYAAKALDMSGIQISVRKLKIKENSEQFVIPLTIPLKSEWQQNSLVNICPVCETSVFSLFCRRHHCRRCGRVVCATCSKQRFKVEGYHTPVRVCKQCFKRLNPISENNPSGTSNLTVVDSMEISDSLEVGWYFTLDPNHIKSLREEFSYDCAPSLSLCLAIMALHKEDKRAALCLLDLCQKLFSLVIEAIPAKSSEVDINFVLKMVQVLLSSAKLRFGKLAENNGVALCEYYTQWVDLLQLLFEAKCTSLLPSSCLRNMINIGELQHQQLSGKSVNAAIIQQNLEQELRYLRVLRAGLVKNEMWQLALNVSTKAGFETTGVWGAYAMASLKAGDFVAARDYFCKVLNKRKDKNITVKSSLLNDILSFLENQQCIFKNKSGKISPEFLLSNQNSISGSNYAVFVTQSLSNLNLIANGGLNTLEDTGLLPAGKPSLDPLLQRECEYYIRLYGCHRTYLQFLLRYERLYDAVKYCHEMDVAGEIFVEEIILTSFRKGQFSTLWKMIKEVDSKEKWSPSILLLSCKWMEKNKYLHCLLEIQKCLGDNLRSAITLVRLYTHCADSFSELLNRKHYLSEVKDHLQAYLNKIPLSESSAMRTRPPRGLASLRLHSSSWVVNQQIHLCNFQDDVVKYLNEGERGSLKSLIEDVKKIVETEVKAHRRKAKINSLVPTVFHKEERLTVCVVTICCGGNITKGLSLVYRLVETNSINPKELLTITLRVLAEQKNFKDMPLLMKGILEWGLIPTSQIKMILWPTLILVGRIAPENTVKNLVNFLPNPSDKVESHMEVGLLKLAYFQIIETGKIEDFKKLLQLATEKNDKTVIYNCNKWLQNYDRRS